MLNGTPCACWQKQLSCTQLHDVRQLVFVNFAWRKYELKLGEIPSLEKKADDDELAWLASTKLSLSTK